ncbi:uncharacterized protein UMAG_10366 [Mycosarcoma maydis]|uniref:Uncharacterized protein n=1 Tax=Mycosarcoma maydis TaxID=5270 RepID=A0A0D1C631_MYCMD|nr:uncharacterized protein UMAG_10366 [Ustilago maydis 521]KIS69072.1 hypothetical protein UMAG_10366 [Ustilago maydis 521]|eukprot:XP_011389508.1 hypothetical protein UMAG_10366 [Ustilago maydis 521]
MQLFPSIAEKQEGWLQSTVRTLGSYAQISTPAYSLAALFALSTPFGFASPAQAAAEAAAKLQYQKHIAQLAHSVSSQGSNGLVARLVAQVQTQKAAKSQTHAPLRVIPPFWQLAFFAAAFGTGGYIIDQGDALNGSGVVSAWSLTYLLFKTIPSIKQLPKNPLAFLLSSSVLSIGLGIHGCHYFDRTSWRGDIPSLTAADAQEVETQGRSRLITIQKVGKVDSSDAPTSIFAAKPDSATASTTSSIHQATSAPNLIHGCTRNNDDARTAAFLYRQGRRSPPGPIVL